ncbi:MAG: hypothetical protein ABIK44_01445 [candidate division WOR-3 bacterium]
MLRGRLREEPGYVETWGTYKGLLEVWTEGPQLVVKGECTDIVELYSWLLPSIQNAHPDRDILLGRIAIPETEETRARLRARVRVFLNRNSGQMTVVTPSRRVRL